IETPHVDALARLGARFTQAYTPVPITLPAHTAIFTGSFPMATGMHDFSGNKLPANGATLAKVLRDNGYTTAAFIGAAVLDSRFGLNQGFETYFDHFDFSRLDETNLDLTERRGDLVMDEALGWLKQTPRQPFLLWVHLYDPHFPYTPPEPHASRYRTRLYDGEIAFADAQVGRLLSFLKQQGLFDHSVIALAGDHGEGLGEHGEKTHGSFIYDLRSDPRELKNLYSARQSLAHEMHDRLYGVIRRFTPAAGNSAAEKELTDPALLERLRSLGYVALSAGSFVEPSGRSLPDPKD